MKISQSTKRKIAVLIWFFAAIIFCICLLGLITDNNYNLKRRRFNAESHLYYAVEALSSYAETEDIHDWNAAAEGFHAFSVLAYEGNLTFESGDSNKIISSDAAENCYAVSEAMLINREAALSYSDEILGALKLLKDDIGSAEAADTLKEIKAAIEQAADR